jgi:hypothetical protein
MTSVLRGFSLKFSMQGGILFPLDQKLHALAVKFADENLCEKINFADYESVLVVAECDDKGEPTKVVAINARVAIWDYPVWRFVDEAAGKVLIDRTRAKLDDEGLKGREVFVHVRDHEQQETRCPKWKKFLRFVGAEKASRWRVRV